MTRSDFWLDMCVRMCFFWRGTRPGAFLVSFSSQSNKRAEINAVIKTTDNGEHVQNQENALQTQHARAHKQTRHRYSK